jgi:mRNA-degrading endonuclease RelE of RelBE toxin-antitoxin system
LYSKEYHPAFRKDLKKLDKPVVKEIEKCVIEIANTPALREELTGDLVGILSYHLKLNGT